VCQRYGFESQYSILGGIMGASVITNKYATQGQSPSVHRRSKVQHLVLLTRMTLTCLFNKIAARDPTVFPAWEVLRMATVEGAQAIGLGDEIGSLAVGKQADLILVDLTALNLSPVLMEPIRQACTQAAQPGLCRQRARSQDRDRGGQGTRTRWGGVDHRRSGYLY
jgi:hypothetical protein